MTITIEIAKQYQVQDCLDCIKHSRLWEAYFESNAGAEQKIRERIDKREVYVAADENGNCIGFMGIIGEGCFGHFPYLSILAVKKDHRGKGIGKALLRKFEEIGFENKDTIFLLVSDFNKTAKSLYKKMGYDEAGSLPDLFKEGITESILVKNK
jgi:ribosomal protein S18 acetylase RimI-like enzyme